MVPVVTPKLARYLAIYKPMVETMMLVGSCVGNRMIPGFLRIASIRTRCPFDWLVCLDIDDFYWCRFVLCPIYQGHRFFWGSVVVFGWGK